MIRRVTLRLLIEASLAALSASLGLLTYVWPSWLEAVLHVDPDGGSGAVEWLVVAGLVVATATFAFRARTEWLRHAGEAG
jgi:hypothetical protein